MPRLLRLLSLLLVLSAGGGCALNPVSGGSDFVVLTESQEIALGERGAAQVDRQYSRYEQPALQAYVTRIGQRLSAVSHRPKLDWRFTVLDSPEVNAFALPGGRIYLTRGLMAYLNSEAELAAVLGHEIGHVTARHAVNQVSKTAAFGLGLEILGTRVPELRSTGAQQNLQLLGDVLLKGYGREHELQSDRLGAEYLARAGYNPEAMIAVITVLKNQEEYEKRRAAAEGRAAYIYHGVFATHPSNDRRLTQVVEEARRFRVADTANHVGRGEYLNQVQDLRFGDDATHGVVLGRQFLNRELDLAIAFPPGWRLHNSRTALVAVSPARDAVIQMEQPPLTIGHHTPATYLRALLKRDQFEAANAPDLKAGRASATSRASITAHDPRTRVPGVPPITPPIGEIVK